jgi:hypothetical protein
VLSSTVLVPCFLEDDMAHLRPSELRELTSSD